MLTYPRPKFPFFAQAGNPVTGVPRWKPAPADTAVKLSPGAGLLLTVLLALGLWATIWKAVSSVTAAWLG